MGNITLLELNVPEGDIQLGPKSFRGSKTDSLATETAESESESETDSDSGGSPLGKILLVGIVVATLAIIATKFLSEDADDEIAGFDDEN